MTQPFNPTSRRARSNDAVSRVRPLAVVFTKRVDRAAASASITARARVSCAVSVCPSRVARFWEWAQTARRCPGCCSGSQTGARRRLFVVVRVLPWRGVIVLISCPSVNASPFQWK